MSVHAYKIVEKGKPLSQATKALILLHGRGATATDIIGLASEFASEGFYIAAPQASNNSWYPFSFLAPIESNQPYLDSAISVVKRLLVDTAAVIGWQNVYLMGFSQGACLCLEVAARFPQKYAGIAAFTGGLIGQKLDNDKYKGDFLQTPVYIGNSNADPHVPLSRSEESSQIIHNLNAKVKLDIYPNMPHTIIKEEIHQVKTMMFQ